MKSLSSRKFLLEFWKERGEKLMTCHLFLDNFWDLRPLGYFQRFMSFETGFCFKKTQVSQFWYHEMFAFLWISVFRKRRDIAEILIVFSCLQFADCYIWSRIFVMWCDCRVLITITESFSLKSFLGENMVLSKTCLSFSESYL